MELAIKGTVKKILEEKSGEGKNGQWRKRDFILETEGQYSKKVCITQWNDAIDKANVREGEFLAAHIDIQSREYKGNWYTDVKAWKIERPDGNGGSSGSTDSTESSGKKQKSGPPKPSEELYEMDDDAPF